MYQAAEHNFNRLSPISILYKFIRIAPNFAIPIYLAVWQGSMENWFFIALAIFLAIFSVPSLILNYIYFQYSINEKELAIYSGVFSKNYRIIKLERIQNISIEQNLLQRLLGVAKLQLETAGDSSAEAALDGVTLRYAKFAKELIYQYKQELQEKPNEDIQEKIDVELNSYETTKDLKENEINNSIFNLNIKDNLTYGALRFRPILLVVAAYAFNILNQYVPNYMDKLFDFIDYEMDGYVEQQASIENIIIFVLILIVVVLISWLGDILLTFNQFFNFNLSIEKDKLHTSQGLLGRRTGAIPLSKLQTIILYTNYPRFKLGYLGLALETAAFGVASGSKAPEVAIPFAKRERVIEVANQILNFRLPTDFLNVSRLTIRRATIKYSIFFAIFVSTLATIHINWLFLLFLSPILYYLAKLRYNYRGYYLENDKIYIKRGFWNQKIFIIPIDKVQGIEIVSNFFQRRLNLADLEIQTAANSPFAKASIVDLGIDEANYLSKRIMEIFLRNQNEKMTVKQKNGLK